MKAYGQTGILGDLALVHATVLQKETEQETLQEAIRLALEMQLRKEPVQVELFYYIKFPSLLSIL